MDLNNCANPAVATAMGKPKVCLPRVHVVKVGYQSLTEITSIADTDQLITGIVMTGGALFQPIDSIMVNAAFTYAKGDDDLYTTTLTLDFGGFTHELRKTMIEISGMCDLVFWVQTSDCKYRFVGIDKLDDEWVSLIDSKQTGDDGTMGGQSDASNVAVFAARTFTPPPFTTIDFATLPTPA